MAVEDLLSESEAQLLAQLGLLSAWQGQHADAQFIFEGLAAVFPESNVVLCTSSLAMLAAGKIGDALEILKPVVKREPSAMFPKSLLALALKEGGLPGWEPLVEEVIDDGTDERAVELATSLVGNKRAKSEKPPTRSSGVVRAGRV